MLDKADGDMHLIFNLPYSALALCLLMLEMKAIHKIPYCCLLQQPTKHNISGNNMPRNVCLSIS